MALRDTWTPKVDDVDDVMASDINEVAAAVIKIEEEGVSGGGGMTETDVEDYIKENVIEPKGILLPSSNESIIAQTWDDYQIRSSPKTLGYIINNDMMTEEQVRGILDDGIDFLNVKQLLTAYALHIDSDLSHIVVADGKGNRISLRDVIATKSDKTNIVEGVDDSIVTLVHNTEYRIGEIPSSFVFGFPSSLETDYISSVVFSTGSSAPVLTYPDVIHWSGDDLTDGKFVPVANKYYTVVFWYDGMYLNGAVRGVEV